MKRTVLAVLFCLAPVSGWLACTQDPVAISIYEMCYPPTPDSSGTCSYSSECDQTTAAGQIWVNLTQTGGTLYMPLEIVNQIPNNEDSATEVNTNDAVIHEFRMTYSGDGVSGSAVSYHTRTVPAGGNTTVLVALIPYGAIDQITIGSQTEWMFVNVRAAGALVNGQEFETDEFQIPVALTDGYQGCAEGEVLKGCCPQCGQYAVPLCEQEESAALASSAPGEQLP